MGWPRVLGGTSCNQANFDQETLNLLLKQLSIEGKFQNISLFCRKICPKGKVTWASSMVSSKVDLVTLKTNFINIFMSSFIDFCYKTHYGNHSQFFVDCVPHNIWYDLQIWSESWISIGTA